MFKLNLKILPKALEAAYPSLVLITLVSSMAFQALALSTSMDSDNPPYENSSQFVQTETEPKLAPAQAIGLM